MMNYNPLIVTQQLMINALQQLQGFCNVTSKEERAIIGSIGITLENVLECVKTAIPITNNIALLTQIHASVANLEQKYEITQIIIANAPKDYTEVIKTTVASIIDDTKENARIQLHIQL